MSVLRERKLLRDKDTPECGNLSSYDLSGAEIKPRSLDPQPAYTNRMQEETGCSGQDDTRFLSVQRMGAESVVVPVKEFMSDLPLAITF